MTKIVLLVDDDGTFVSAWSDSEVDFSIVKPDTTQADVTQAELDELTEN